MSNRYTMGYSDFLREIADEITEARHIRFIKTPSGRKLYMAVSSADDEVDRAEIGLLVRCANADLDAN